MDLEKPTPASEFIGTMAEKLGAVAKAATIFGEPVERAGVTIIPVAKARWGFGGGAGHRKKGDDAGNLGGGSPERRAGEEEDGGGGGGGVTVTPVGFIEIKDGQAEFRPIRSPSLPWMIVGGFATLFLLRQVLKRVS
jgi:uncharacterized spore protein YtfJ